MGDFNADAAKKKKKKKRSWWDDFMLWFQNQWAGVERTFGEGGGPDMGCCSGGGIRGIVGGGEPIDPGRFADPMIPGLGPVILPILEVELLQPLTPGHTIETGGRSILTPEVLRASHARFYADGEFLDVSELLDLSNHEGRILRDVTIVYSALLSGKTAELLVDQKVVAIANLGRGSRLEVVLSAEQSVGPNFLLRARFQMARGRVKVHEVRAALD